MILAFKKHFVSKIQSGQKKHTIRLDPYGRWKADRAIQMANGVRTPNYNCFNESKCISIQQINIYNSDRHDFEVWIDGIKLNQSEIDLLAQNDGFNNTQEFMDWFIPIIDKSPYDMIVAKIIHWTNLKY